MEPLEERAVGALPELNGLLRQPGRKLHLSVTTAWSVVPKSQARQPLLNQGSVAETSCPAFHPGPALQHAVTPRQRGWGRACPGALAPPSTGGRCIMPGFSRLPATAAG